MNDELEQKKGSEPAEEMAPIGRGFFASAGLFFLEVIKVVVLAAITVNLS